MNSRYAFASLTLVFASACAVAEDPAQGNSNTPDVVETAGDALTVASCPQTFSLTLNRVQIAGETSFWNSVGPTLGADPELQAVALATATSQRNAMNALLAEQGSSFVVRGRLARRAGGECYYSAAVGTGRRTRPLTQEVLFSSTGTGAGRRLMLQVALTPPTYIGLKAFNNKVTVFPTSYSAAGIVVAPNTFIRVRSELPANGFCGDDVWCRETFNLGSSLASLAL